MVMLEQTVLFVVVDRMISMIEDETMTLDYDMVLTMMSMMIDDDETDTSVNNEINKICPNLIYTCPSSPCLAVPSSSQSSVDKMNPIIVDSFM